MTEIKAIQNYQFKNWSQTYSCNPERYYEPKNLEDLRETILLAKETDKKIRVVGSGHSSSDIVCTSDYLVSLKNFNKVLAINQQKKTVKVEVGTTFSKLNPILYENSLSFSVLGPIADNTVGGAISVAVHGTGLKFKVFSHYVNELEFLTSSGDLIKCSRNENPDVFLSILCGLGAIGIIINVTLQCENCFLLHNFVQTITLDEIIEDFLDLLESDHVKFDWFPHTNNVLVHHYNRIYNSKPTKFSILDKVTDWIVNYAIGFYGLEFCYWVASYFPKIIPFINRIFFKVVYSKQNEFIDLSYKVFSKKPLFNQYVNEWSIPIEYTSVVLLQLRRFLETSNDVFVHYPIEIRFVKADDIYLSPAFGRDSCYINIAMYKPYGKKVDFKKYWDFFEQIMKDVGGRPHWAKAHRETSSDFIKMYPYFRAWAQIKKRVDPISMFYNQYLERILPVKNSP